MKVAWPGVARSRPVNQIQRGTRLVVEKQLGSFIPVRGVGVRFRVGVRVRVKG